MTFHLAIPCKDVDEAVEFYKKLGCEVGRKTQSQAILNFFETQLVVHQSGEWDRDIKMYPRHFGIILSSKSAFSTLWKRWQFADFIFEEYFNRHKGKPEEHETFFLKDPSNNLIEFKWYKNSNMIFGS